MLDEKNPSIESLVHHYAAMHRRNQTSGNSKNKKEALGNARTALISGIGEPAAEAVMQRIAKNLKQQKKLDVENRQELSSVYQRLATVNALLYQDPQYDAIKMFEAVKDKAYYQEDTLKSYASFLLVRASIDPQQNATAIVYAQEALHTLSYLHSKNAEKTDAVKLFDIIKNQDQVKFDTLFAKKNAIKLLKQVDEYGNTPLMVATELKAYDMIKVMVAKLVDNDQTKYDVLGHKNHGGDDVFTIARGDEGSEEREVYKTLGKPFGIIPAYAIRSSKKAEYKQAADQTKMALMEAIDENKQPIANNTNDIIEQLTSGIEKGNSTLINQAITQAVYAGVSQAVLNRGISDEEDKPFLHQILGMQIPQGSQAEKEQIKLDCFNRLLDAGADPTLNTGTAASIFSSILTAADKSHTANHGAALKILEKLHSIGIRVPDDKRIAIIAQQATDTGSL